MEKTKSRKEWVKTALIIFLSIMLVLTFFSQTIMNYSLPQVATQYMWGGNITSKVRASGTVTSSDPYELQAKENRVIESVAIYQGNYVEKGDVLYTLMPAETNEEGSAYTTYQSLLKAFEDRIITEGISTAMMNRVKNGTSAEFNANQKLLETLRKNVDNAQSTVDGIQKTIDGLNKQKEQLILSGGDVTSELAAVKQAETDYKNAVQSNKNADELLRQAENKYVAAGGNLESTPDESASEELKTAYSELLFWRQAKVNAANGVTLMQTRLEEAQDALDKKTASQTEGIDKQISSVKLELTDAQEKLTAAQTKLTETNSEILTEMSLIKDWEAVKQAEENWQSLASSETKDYVLAPISGTVTSLNYVAGNKYSAGDTLAVIQPEGSQYKVNLTVTNEQARRLYVGDVADISDSWYYYDIKATIESIKPDPSSPQKNKIVTCALSGECTPGQQLTLTMGQTSNYYDKVVPTNCIHEDNKGKFILIVNAKSSPLGNRYYAERVDITVVTSDETQSAITGNIYGSESVITTSTMPIKAGDQVRLAQN